MSPNLDLERLERKVARYSLWPAGETGRVPQTVFLVPPGSSLSVGFEMAERALHEGTTVQLVGVASTLPSTWPDWVRSRAGLKLTELGAYQVRSRIEASAPLRRALAEWCDEVFDGIVEGVPGSEIIYSSAAARLVQHTMNTCALVEGLAAVHADDHVVYTNDEWPGLVLLDEMREKGDLTEYRALSARLIPETLAGIAVALARKIRERINAAPALRKLSELRDEEKEAPSVWLGVIADWPRINAYLLEALARPLSRERTPFGIVLLQSFGIGTRSEEDMRVDGSDLWSGLGPFRDDLRGRTVEQAVMPEGAWPLARAVLGAVAASVRATTRVVRRGPWIGSRPGARVCLRGRERELAKLMSMDVVRARLAAAAAAEIARKRSFDGVPVVFSASNMDALAAVERVLHRAGARTAEFTHGIGADAWHGTAETRADVRFVWTRTDALALAPLGRPIRVAGLPVPLMRRSPTEASRVLLLTNYFHRDLMAGGGPDRAALQGELLGMPALLRAAAPELGLEFRWRPHPAELDGMVRDAHRMLNDVALSRGCALIEDFEWADLIISSYSSTVVEAMFAGIPAFVHLRPELEDTPFCGFIANERRFFYARDVVDRVVHCIRQLRAGDATVLLPEERGREAVVGSSQQPTALRDAMREWTSEHSPTFEPLVASGG